MVFLSIPLFLAFEIRLGGFIAFLVYMITTYALYVPDWSFTIHDDDGKSETFTVVCGMRGHLGPACNAVGYVDREVWGINHLYSLPVWIRLKACTLNSPESGPLRPDAPTWCRAPFEPEGLLSSISAILTGVIGIHYGHVLIHFKGHAERLKQWVTMGVGLLIIDIWGKRTPFLLFEWIGMNAMLVFVLGAQGILAGFINGWYYKNVDNNLVNWIRDHVFIDVWNSERFGTLLYVIFVEITFWGVISGILHKLGIYWKL
ncbi:hypothetical protein HanRHA438_Chr14g0633911 [Helianthus annuus]|uniref:Heparan-alpha-glucosaminide N-acetyltransferase catalytic domain-containing protein n=1 Tax=Helianthus annuus TaxID=4232 RepID=A0A251SDV0_HELAN|nr:hypothetical protein HanXRQr2_Chr14g0624011 [Helianthus annuus]KAJ0462956.1 hypothetical protein HanHA300_Chr14g0509851 [Helianthus annuus]KAJ0484314.1 hypothetical protein HanHA89_Chr14g0542761 [Helianthus annuus]KAJ0658602.1 hypothetical protein HanOQP8_Chr14g0510101 [Helianthus annuus]KAJ0838779.1 hypothetical protein HanPSC8_Chr14g0598831 [Helianthus annuus]